MIEFPIKGVKWFKDIIEDSSRQFGVDVHVHLPQKEVDLPAYGMGTEIIRLPEQQKLINDLEQYVGRFERTRIFPDAYAATIQDGTVVGNSGMVITPDGYLIAETASLTGFADGRSFTIEHLKNSAFNPAYKEHLKGHLLSTVSPNYGFAHQLCESLFSLLRFNDMDIDYIHVVEGENLDRIKEFITDYEISSELLYATTASEIVSADRVSFYGPSSYALLRPETVEFVKELLVKPRIDSSVIPTKKVYFSTGVKTIGAHYRKINNLDKVETFLQEEGVEFIDPATLTTPEKIDYLQNVDTIMAPYGSAGINSLFSLNPKLKLINMAYPMHFLQRNIMGMNIPIPHYSQHAISPIYPELCFNNGFLKTISQVNYNLPLAPITGQFFQKFPDEFTGPYCGEIDIELFQKFYRHFMKVANNR